MFDAFPRTGMPRAFGAYAHYTEAIDALIEAGAIPDAAGLVGLVQCLVRSAAEGPAPEEPSPELLAENRFLAMRDGPSARLIGGPRRVEVRRALDDVLEECRPHARELGCEEDLEEVRRLGRAGGAAFQREAARIMGVHGVPTALADTYAPRPTG